ncbi:thiamine phosphate synthase [soil metagenome]
MNSELRIIDANLNRAREGLRVMEDAARFVLENERICRELKVIRHGLQAASGAAMLDELLLQAARSAAEDVGTDIKTEREIHRANLRDAVIAAGKRVGEALRSVEECVKVLGRSDAAREFERLRYRCYDVERDLVIAMGSGRATQWSVCVLVTEKLCRRPWREVVEAAIEAGADCVQLRELELSDGEFLGRAESISVWAQKIRWGATRFIVNDRVDIALLTAHGVHLGQGDLPVLETRRLAGARLMVGVSTHDLDEARAAHAAGADYCGVGAMFATATKPREVSGVEYLRQYLGEPGVRHVPHLAIGGITPENIGELVDAGCRGVAVSGVVCGAERPGEVVHALRRALERGDANAARAVSASA